MRNGETKHLCDDECFKTFRARPTSFLQSTTTRRAAAAAEGDHCHAAAVSSDQSTHAVGKVSKTFGQEVSQLAELLLCIFCQETCGVLTFSDVTIVEIDTEIAILWEIERNQYHDFLEQV